MEIVVYGRDNCSSCKKTKDLLDNKQLDYEYIDVLDLDKDAREDIKKKHNMNTVPIILIKDRNFTGGYTDLVSWFENNIVIGVPTKKMGLQGH